MHGFQTFPFKIKTCIYNKDTCWKTKFFKLTVDIFGCSTFLLYSQRFTGRVTTRGSPTILLYSWDNERTLWLVESVVSTPAILLSDSSDGMDSNLLNSLNLEFIALNERSPDFLTAGLCKQNLTLYTQIKIYKQDTCKS